MSNTLLRRRGRWPAALLVMVTTGVLAALTCAGGNAVAAHQRLSRGPVVWHAGRVALSAEITNNPHCAPPGPDLLGAAPTAPAALLLNLGLSLHAAAGPLAAVQVARHPHTRGLRRRLSEPEPTA